MTAACLAPLSVAQAADDAATFYQGKQIRFFTMGSPGGGYDTYTRTVGAYLERKLGAKVIPTNEPMAGGMIAMNRTMNAAPDGLTLLLTGGEGLVTAQLYGLSGVNYDVRKQVWLARVSGEDKVAVVGPPSPLRTLTDMQKSDKTTIWAGSGKADNNSDFSAITCYALNAKCKIIVGYKGTGDMNIAIARGEVDGRVISDEAAALYGPSSGMRVLATLARNRSEKFPDVPTVFEAAPLPPDGCAAARMARRHRRARPGDPGHARHAAGPRRPVAQGAGRDPARSGLYRRGQEGEPRRRLRQRR